MTPHEHYANLMRTLHKKDTELFRNFLRVDKDLFKKIVEQMEPLIQNWKTFMSDPLDAGQCVAITLRFLTFGNSYKSLCYAFRVTPNTISKTVPETYMAIVAVYGDRC